MDSTQNKPLTITYGESPPLLPGAKRLHYQFSAALPQTHLTFVSVLQGLVFSALLLNISLPPQNVSWSTIFDFSLKQYLYLPYIISSLIIIIIWTQFVHASMFVTWPLSIFQYTLLFLLTMAEILTFRELKVVSGGLEAASFSTWLFGLGWVGIFGGIIRIHNIRWYHPRPPYPGSVIRKNRHKQDLSDGLSYIGGGILWIIISQLYGQIVLLIPFFPWIILGLTIAILCVFTFVYKLFYQSHLKDLAKDSDLDVLRSGLIRYKKELSESSSKGSSQSVVHQQTDPDLSQKLSDQHPGMPKKPSTLQWKRLFGMFHLGFTGLTVCAIGIWILRRHKRF